MATYTRKPYFIEAFQFTPESTHGVVNTEHPSLPAGFDGCVEGVNGRLFLLRFGDYIVVDEQSDKYFVALKEDFEKEWVECPI